MSVAKKAIYRKPVTQICCKESNFIFASSGFEKRTCFTNSRVNVYYLKKKTPKLLLSLF